MVEAVAYMLGVYADRTEWLPTADESYSPVRRPLIRCFTVLSRVDMEGTWYTLLPFPASSLCLY